MIKRGMQGVHREADSLHHQRGTYQARHPDGHDYLQRNCNEVWALQYGGYAEILEPKSLRDSIRKAVKYMSEVYR